MKLLDKYILKQIIEMFVMGVLIFTSIIFASDTFITLIKQISMYGIPFKIAFLIIILHLPSVFVMTIPMGVLLATVLTLNSLSLNSEITVMRACGIGINRIAKPIFIFSVIMALTSFFLNETVVPVMTKRSTDLALYAFSKKNIPEGKENFTFKEIKDSGTLKRLFYVGDCTDGNLHNITVLDASKEGTIQSGTANNTIYAKDDESKMYGGVKFFDIDPENTMIEKEITINYKGRDYYPSTIKFTPDNGSWRIQLKGDPKDGTEPLSKHGNKQEFVNKILIFEKINTNYFALSLIEDSELDIIKTQSRVWAVNGNNPNSKAYGMLL